jgi:hypothetical protein
VPIAPRTGEILADLGVVEQFRDTAMDLILRYQTTINRQLFQAMNQLERLQRPRKGGECRSAVGARHADNLRSRELRTMSVPRIWPK